MILQSCLQWYGHVIQGDINSQIREVMELQTTGERKKSPARKLWEECVKKYLKWYGLRGEDTYDQEKWQEQIKAKIANQQRFLKRCGDSGKYRKKPLPVKVSDYRLLLNARLKFSLIMSPIFCFYFFVPVKMYFEWLGVMKPSSALFTFIYFFSSPKCIRMQLSQCEKLRRLKPLLNSFIVTYFNWSVSFHFRKYQFLSFS